MTRTESDVPPVYSSCVGAPWDQEPTKALVYANWVRAGYSPFDLTLDFGYRRSPEPPASFPARIVFSWEQAKVLHKLLEHALDEYEQNAGPIRDVSGEVGQAREVPDPDPGKEA